jgi:hypothetical protein
MKKKVKKVTKASLLKKEKRKIKKEFKLLWNELREKVKTNQNNKCYFDNCQREVFGKSAHIHHIISRDIKILKYDIFNLVLLCPSHHKLHPLSVHQTSIYFSEMLRIKEPDRYNYLIKRLEEYNRKV